MPRPSVFVVLPALVVVATTTLCAGGHPATAVKVV